MLQLNIEKVSHLITIDVCLYFDLHSARFSRFADLLFELILPRLKKLVESMRLALKCDPVLSGKLFNSILKFFIDSPDCFYLRDVGVHFV